MSDFLNTINYINRESDLALSGHNTDETDFEIVDMSVLTAFEEVQGKGEPDLIVELIDLYLAEFPKKLSAMKDFVMNNDWDSLKRIAHNLKGSSANLGVNGIAQLCQKIEQTDFSKSLHFSNIFITLLEQTFMRVHQILNAERQSRI